MPFSSQFPDLEIPDVDLWSCFFDRQSKQFNGQNRIFTDSITGRFYTYDDVERLSISAGQAIKAAFSLNHGARISFFTTNNIDTAILTFATLWAGATACPVNPQYTVSELAHQLKDSRVQVIITLASLLPTARAAAKTAGVPETNIILLGDERHAEFKHWTELPPAPHVKKAEINPSKDLAFVVYSSGTTGLPKGVMLVHRNLVANITQFGLVEWSSSISGIDKTLGILPFYHIYGLTSVLLSAIYRGLEVFVMSSFDLERACQLIQDHHITSLSVPPPIVLNLAKSPIPLKYNLTSLRWITSGAAPLTRELAEALWDRLKIGTKQGYGMSETSPVVCVQYPDEWRRFIGSVGRLVPNMQAKIVDDEGREVEDGQPGELLVRGPNVFPGYLNLPHLNKDVFTEDGFLKTGDVVYKDKYDMIYVADRAKELIKYKGFQVPPAELEGLLVSHPDIADACVIGIMDHSRASEVPRAYLVPRPGLTPSSALASDIQAWTASKVAPYKRLRGGVRWVSEIPKSGAGKILRRMVKDMDRKESKMTKL